LYRDFSVNARVKYKRHFFRQNSHDIIIYLSLSSGQLLCLSAKRLFALILKGKPYKPLPFLESSCVTKYVTKLSCEKSKAILQLNRQLSTNPQVPLLKNGYLDRHINFDIVTTSHDN